MIILIKQYFDNYHNTIYVPKKTQSNDWDLNIIEV